MHSASSIIDDFRRCGQGHVFAHWDKLSEANQRTLLNQAAQVRLAELQKCVNLIHTDGVHHPDLSSIQAPVTIERPEPELEWADGPWLQAHTHGEHILRQGRVAAFTVAGGQSTRLGTPVPKGTLGVTPVRQHSLFQLFAHKIQAAQNRYNTLIPWFIMTSPLNHVATVHFFAHNRYFGLEHVFFFSQNMMPAVDLEGKIILETPHSIAMTPDGHGGAIKSLIASGALQKMREFGCDLISYFQVDNPLVHCIDPAFIGFHVLGQSDMSSKVVTKNHADEKVGVFCKLNGTLNVIEYSDLPSDLAHSCLPDGTLQYRMANIAVHMLSRDFVHMLGRSANSLPYHLARKKIPYYDAETGYTLTPDAINGIKFESFIFDALKEARNPLLLPTRREDEFSPIKNTQGADSLATAHNDQLRLFARWLQAAGVPLITDATGLPEFKIEISPLFAGTQHHFVHHWDMRRFKPSSIRDGFCL